MILVVLALVPAGVVVGCPLTWLMRRVAMRTGQVDRPGQRKIHHAPTAVTGGVAIFATVAGLVLAAVAGAWVVPESTWQRLLPIVAVHAAGVRSQTALAVGLVAALGVLHGMGLVDDRRGLGPGVKLAVQVAVATAVVLAFDVRLLTMLGQGPSVVVTVLWLVGVTNAINFMDNMDGLAGGVAAIASSMLLSCALLSGQWFVAGLLAILIGALLGFLAFNLPPASIFMGDGGSLVVGFVLGYAAVEVTYVQLPTGGAAGDAAWWALFTPLVVLAVPLYDLVSVTAIRLAQGKSPLQGDTQHFSHRLVKRGLSRPAAVVVIYAWTLATGLGGVLLGRVPGWAAGMVVAQCGAILLGLALLERSGEPTHLGRGDRL